MLFGPYMKAACIFIASSPLRFSIVPPRRAAGKRRISIEIRNYFEMLPHGCGKFRTGDSKKTGAYKNNYIYRGSEGACDARERGIMW